MRAFSLAGTTPTERFPRLHGASPLIELNPGQDATGSQLASCLIPHFLSQ